MTIKKKQISQLSPAKRNLYKLIAFILPVAFLTVVEFSLRIFNIGEDFTLSVPFEKNHNYLTVNLDIAEKFFSKKSGVSIVAQDFFLKEKSPSTLRIFTMGGSTTAGYPYFFNGSFPSMLKDRISHAYPDYNVEVINLGITAATSFAILDLMNEVLAQDPDFIIVYTGHNEFYGALGTGSTQGIKGSRFLTLVYLKMRQLRLFQLLQSAIFKIIDLIPSTIPRNGGTLMARMVKDQAISKGSDLYFKTLNIFYANMKGIIQKAQKEDVPVLIGTLVSNLSDQRPFVSTFQNPTETDQINNYINQAKRQMIKKNYDEAIHKLISAINFDSTYALSHFYAGKCYEHLGQYEQAMEAYTKARDYDGLRFRASSDINEILRKLGKVEGVYLADIEQAFMQNSPNGITGNELMLEHLHPNLDGYFLMAKAFSNAIINDNLFKLNIVHNPAESDDWYRDQMSITQLDLKIAEYRIDILISGWPFKQDHRTLSPSMIKTSSYLEEQSKAVVAAESNYERAHVALAEYYKREGKFTEAILEYRALAKSTPIHESPFLELGRLLVHTRRFEEALTYLQRATELSEDQFSYKWAGTILVDQGKVEQGIPYLQKTLELNPEDYQTHYNLSGAYFLNRDTSRAITELEKLLELNPDFPDAQRFYKDLKSVYK